MSSEIAHIPYCGSGTAPDGVGLQPAKCATVAKPNMRLVFLALRAQLVEMAGARDMLGKVEEAVTFTPQQLAGRQTVCLHPNRRRSGIR